MDENRKPYCQTIVSQMPKTARQIEGSKDFVDIDGSVYTYRSSYLGIKTDIVVKKAQRVISGYKYCSVYICSEKKCRTMRVHRLVAKAFIPNPNNYPIVGHRNNIKTDNRIENLYWTTWQENIQKAVDDGLLVNDKGFDDSQSKPVAMFETTTNKKIGEFGSISEAARLLNMSTTTIARQAKYHRPVRKPTYFRFLDDETVVANQIVGMFDYDTDTLLDTFFNIGEAARQTGYNEKTISQQTKVGKPKVKHSNRYFLYVTSKCEQTIEH